MTASMLVFLFLAPGQAIPPDRASLPIATVDNPEPEAPPTPRVLEATAPLLPAPKPAPKPTEQPAKPANGAAPDRWFLMKELQGTCIGWCLDGERMQILGWTECSYTASSDQRRNLPLGFNYLAND